MTREGASLYLIQILLPVYDNRGRRIARRRFDHTGRRLLERFGGVTAYTRAPASGLWKPARNRAPVRDSLVVYEVMAAKLDRKWWLRQKLLLESEFRQEDIVIRAQRMLRV